MDHGLQEGRGFANPHSKSAVDTRDSRPCSVGRHTRIGMPADQVQKFLLAEKRLMLAAVEPQPGTYALVLSAKANGLVHVGRLGSLRLQSGFYLYVGSALGSGGIRARLTHHLKTASRPHWHIDYLRLHTTLEEVWYCHDRASWEHQWARHLGTQPGVSIPLAGFGASDCHCKSHLYFFRSRPFRNAFVRSLRASGQRHPQVRLLSLP